MATETFYPQAGAGGDNVTCDGLVGREVVDQSWNDIRNGAGNLSNDTATGANAILLQGDPTENLWIYLYRSIFTIDVSGFTGDVDNITGITFKFYPTTVVDEFAQDLCFVNATPTDPADLADLDFQQAGNIQYAADMDLGAITTDQYNTFTLNDTGIDAVKTALAGTGIFKCGLKFSSDRADSAPSWANTAARIYMSFTDNATIGQRPRLDITYDITDYTMDCGTGTFTLTGNSTIFTKAFEMICTTGSFILAGIDAIFSVAGITWFNQDKSTSISPTDLTKNSINPTCAVKNSISPTNSTKNDISPTNSSKNSITPINSDKS